MLLATTMGAGLRAEEGDVARERRIRAHTKFLADDLLEGRAAATRGHALAMAYVCAQFERLGLEPAGDGGYLQPVSLRESRLKRDAGELMIHDRGVDTPLTVLTEMIARPAAGSERGRVRAPAVFVGFGICAPEFGYDDFARIDVRGKIAVVLSGTPSHLPGTARAHFSRYKLAELSARGAVGVISLGTPDEETRNPWATTANRDRFPSMRLLEPDGTVFEAYPTVQATASVSRAAAAKFFARAPKTIDAVFATAMKNEPQAFPLDLEVTLAGEAEVKDTASGNVLGWLAGTDPTLAAEPIVISAHLDHLGIGSGPGTKGDTIYNGALDNALGTAVMLALAEDLATSPRSARPVLFAAVTAEEKGSLGSHHLARHPPSRVKRFAANLNIDMPVAFSPVRDLIALGQEHSTLGPVTADVAKKHGYTLSADPKPEQNYFVRSDQYSFVKMGVPALFLFLGTHDSQHGAQLVAEEEEFRKKRYHKVTDDLSQPIHWASIAGFARVMTDLGRTVANQKVAPRWNDGDFFGTQFGPKNEPGSRKP